MSETDNTAQPEKARIGFKGAGIIGITAAGVVVTGGLAQRGTRWGRGLRGFATLAGSAVLGGIAAYFGQDEVAVGCVAGGVASLASGALDDIQLASYSKSLVTHRVAAPAGNAALPAGQTTTPPAAGIEPGVVTQYR